MAGYKSAGRATNAGARQESCAKKGLLGGGTGASSMAVPVPWQVHNTCLSTVARVHGLDLPGASPEKSLSAENGGLLTIRYREQRARATVPRPPSASATTEQNGTFACSGRKCSLRILLTGLQARNM
eukprot:358605-Chlamydomonas_euryale.AAC.9